MQPEPELHTDVAHLAFLLGSWKGEGTAEYPTTGTSRYGEEMRFFHVGDPFLIYEQRSWLLEDGSPLHFERGFVRPSGPWRVELVLAHPLGIVEIAEGSVSEGVIDVTSSTVGLTSTAEHRVTGIARRIEVVGDAMSYRLRMATEAVPLTQHLSAQLLRA